MSFDGGMVTPTRSPSRTPLGTELVTDRQATFDHLAEQWKLVQQRTSVQVAHRLESWGDRFDELQTTQQQLTAAGRSTSGPERHLVGSGRPSSTAHRRRSSCYAHGGVCVFDFDVRCQPRHEAQK